MWDAGVTVRCWGAREDDEGCGDAGGCVGVLGAMESCWGPWGAMGPCRAPPDGRCVPAGCPGHCRRSRIPRPTRPPRTPRCHRTTGTQRTDGKRPPETPTWGPRVWPRPLPGGPAHTGGSPAHFAPGPAHRAAGRAPCRTPMWGTLCPLPKVPHGHSQETLFWSPKGPLGMGWVMRLGWDGNGMR